MISKVGRTLSELVPEEVRQEGRNQKMVWILWQLSVTKSLKAFQAGLRFVNDYFLKRVF